MKIDDAVLQAWETRKNLHDEGGKLCLESSNANKENNFKIYAGNEMLWLRGDKLCLEGDMLFFDAVIKAYGNIQVTMKLDNSCVLTIADESIVLK